MIVLGIETSCDETAVAIVCDDLDPKKRILINNLASQIETHMPYAGVVPEVAARAHLEILPRILMQTLNHSGVSIDQVDAIAVACGPGLIGGLMVGMMAGKTLAAFFNKPFIPVNHLKAHALTVRLTDGIDFPYTLLLTSGGHCQLLDVLGVDHFLLKGSTIDDAAGEAFDKTAKLLGLPYPGGPAIEKLAKSGDPKRFNLPRPLKGRDTSDMSFSGLKTAVRILVHELQNNGQLDDQTRADLAASFQAAVCDCLLASCEKLFKKESQNEIHTLVVAGGVAANTLLRLKLEELAKQYGKEFVAPPLKLCTDNAAMIAWAGLEGFRIGHHGDLAFAPRPRWPLEE